MRKVAPVVTLVVLAPVIAELLPGDIGIRQAALLLFFGPIYGAGALLVRELVRRAGGGWASVLLLGAAYGVIEEGLGLQSLFSTGLYGEAAWGPRVLGVDSVYTELVIPLHAVFSIAIPILLAEALFPARRREPWLGRVGIVVTAVVYVLGVLLTAASRGQTDPGYSAPPVLLGLALLVVIALAVVALAVLPRRAPARPAGGAAPGSPAALAVGLVGGFAFLGLLLPLGGAVQPLFTRGSVVLLPMVAALLIGVAGAWLVGRWARMAGWGDRQLVALAGGLLVAHSAIGGLRFPHKTIDRVGVAVLGVAMVVLLALLWVAIERHEKGEATRVTSITSPGQ